MVRNHETSGRLRPRTDFYVWFFGQIHAKRLLLFMQLLLLFASFVGFYYVSDPHFTGLPVPGFDGEKHLFGSWGASAHTITVDDSELFSKAHVDCQSPECLFRRKVIAFMSYFYILRLVSMLFSYRIVDKLWWNCPQGLYRFLNPGVFLIPCLLSILSFACPLFVHTVRAVRNYVSHNCFLQNPVDTCTDMGFYVDITIYVVLPLFIVWIIYGYIIYGCVLGFVYVWRRARGSWVRRETAAASFSWSFRDKNSLWGRLGSTAVLQNKSFTKANNNSWRSTKSTDRPTLRSYKSRQNDLNDSQVSSSSVDTDNANTSTEFCAIDIDEEFRRTDFASHRASIRRPLATVLEEGESQENSLGSDSSRL
ncbi:unnamed protein product [Auanema sp. JU1783]|nr:unnamed protein product [Auanema sp. JU1783]